jgi:hypothetical protein
VSERSEKDGGGDERKQDDIQRGLAWSKPLDAVRMKGYLFLSTVLYMFVRIWLGVYGQKERDFCTFLVLGFCVFGYTTNFAGGRRKGLMEWILTICRPSCNRLLVFFPSNTHTIHTTTILCICLCSLCSHIQDHNPDALAMSEHLYNANRRNRCDHGSQMVAIAVPDIFLFDQASSI